MFTDKPLTLFVDPKVKPVAIHKTAVIPIHLKTWVKADLDRDIRLGILEKVNDFWTRTSQDPHLVLVSTGASLYDKKEEEKNLFLTMADLIFSSKAF